MANHPMMQMRTVHEQNTAMYVICLFNPDASLSVPPPPTLALDSLLLHLPLLLARWIKQSQAVRNTSHPTRAKSTGR